MNNGILLESMTNQVKTTQMPQLTQHSTMLRLQKFEFLFLPGDYKKAIYMIKKGRVKVGTYDDEGNEHIKAFLGKGDWIGEMAFFGLDCNNDFAEVVDDDTIVYKVKMEHARSAFATMPSFNRKLNEYMGKRFKRMERQIEILSCKDVKTRLIKFLKELTIEKGRQLRDKIVVHHGMTQSEIASLIGTSRKTVSLLLNEFHEMGILELSRKKFQLESLKQLAVT